MWWEFLPWLAFLLCLGTTVAVYQHRHRRQLRQLRPPPTVGHDDQARPLSRRSAP